MTCTGPSGAFGHSVRARDVWGSWPRWRKCEEGDHIEIWKQRREAIGGVRYRMEDGRRVLALINMDARPNLCPAVRS